MYDSVPGANPIRLHHATASHEAVSERHSWISDRREGSSWLHTAAGATMPHSPVLDEKAVDFGGIGQGWRKHYLAMLAWGVLLAITLVLASLLQAVAATALAVPEETVLRTAHLDDDPAIGWVETLYTTPESCSLPATDGEACIS
jgi:hypothetical protein